MTTSSFELLARRGSRRLFTAHWKTHDEPWFERLGPDDHVAFSDVSMPGPASQIAEVVKAKMPHPENVTFLCNDLGVLRDRLSVGLKAIFVNQNAFIDDRIFGIDPDADRIYDAVYNARLRPVKRHVLARKVGEARALALIVGFHTPSLESVPEHEVPKTAMRNGYQLLPSTVCRILNQCRIGLILSAAEGACFASGEYLLCGLPVVSTPSSGGRDVWYDDENSIIAEPDEDAVLAAVDALLAEPRDPVRIRESHLRRMHAHRQRFVDCVMAPIFPGTFEASDASEIFDAFNYRRFMVFQKKESWKTRDAIRDGFDGAGFEVALDLDRTTFLR
jgi:glycosyltransferase involved in cell wall biosynthesis